jgi:hypothetical protein
MGRMAPQGVSSRVVGVGLAARVGLARAAGVEVGRRAVGGGGVAVVAWVGTGEGREAEIGGRLAAGDWLQASSSRQRSSKRELRGIRENSRRDFLTDGRDHGRAGRGRFTNRPYRGGG